MEELKFKTDHNVSLRYVPYNTEEPEIDCKIEIFSRFGEPIKIVTLKNVRKIDVCILEDNITLTELIVENVDVIGSNAFYECKSLVSARLDCKMIGDSAFDNCELLKEVTLTNTEVIGECAFCRCTALSVIELPETPREIEAAAFFKSGIRHLIIPPSVKKFRGQVIGEGALEIISNGGTLPAPLEDLFLAGEPGICLTVRSAETNKILYELFLVGDFDNVFTASGINTEKAEYFHYYMQFKDKCISACDRLHDHSELCGDALELLKQYASNIMAFNVTELIETGNSAELGEFPYFDNIYTERFSSLIDYSAQKGTAEITAFLMRKMHERRSCE